MSGHTPGPWKCGTFPGSVHTEDGTNLVRNIGPYSRGGGSPHDERQANTRLICAAPDLLEAAREVEQTITYLSDPSAVAMHECLDALREIVREAIAKATGDA